MKRLLVCSFALLLAQTARAENLNEYQINAIMSLSKQCTNGDWELARARALLSKRSPMTSRTITPACAHVPRTMWSKWLTKDAKDWERIANEWCSHKRGWMEYQPGTCTAGGPPPDHCKRNDHWYESPNAMKQWEKKMDDLQAFRLAEAENAICTCATTELDRMDAQGESTTTAPKGLASRAGSTKKAYPCFRGECLGRLGYTCSSENLCVPTEVTPGEEAAIDIVKDEVKEKLIRDTAADLAKVARVSAPYAAKAIVKVGKFLTGSVTGGVLDFLDGEEIGNSQVAYKASLNDMLRSAQQMQNTIQEIHQLARKRKIGVALPYEVEILRKRFLRIQKELGESWDRAEGHLMGIVNEKDYKRGQCQASLSRSHRIIDAHVSVLKNKSFEMLIGDGT